MFDSTHNFRRLAGLAAVAGAFCALAPIAQAGSGFKGSPDAIDRAVAARQAQLDSSFQGSPDAVDRAVAARQVEQTAAFDAREHAQLSLSPAASDVVERAVTARQLGSTPDLSVMPDVVERTAAAGTLQYQTQDASTSRFDWSDFGIGAGAGIGAMVLLIVLGVGLLNLRPSGRQVSRA